MHELNYFDNVNKLDDGFSLCNLNKLEKKLLKLQMRIIWASFYLYKYINTINKYGINKLLQMI